MGTWHHASNSQGMVKYLSILKKATNERTFHHRPSVIRGFSPVVNARARLHSGWLQFRIQCAGVFNWRMEMADRVMVGTVHYFTLKRVCPVNRRLCFQPNLTETQKVWESPVPTDTGCKIRHFRDLCANVRQLTSVRASSWDGFGAYPFATEWASFSEEQHWFVLQCEHLKYPLFSKNSQWLQKHHIAWFYSKRNRILCRWTPILGLIERLQDLMREDSCDTACFIAAWVKALMPENITSIKHIDLNGLQPAMCSI